jgi:hypothetical protein
MRIAFLVLLVAGCGKSECEDYATVYCIKYSGCIERVSQDECVASLIRGLEAARLSESACATARKKYAAMSCDAFRADFASRTR